MDCPCYRIIYSIMPTHVPACVVTIISTYSHVISDLTFARYQAENPKFWMDIDNTFMYTFAGTRSTTTTHKLCRMTDDCINLSYKHTYDICISSTIDCKYRINTIFNVDNIYEFLHQNFSPKTKKSRRRMKSIWDSLGPKQPMTNSYKNLCRNMLDVIDTWANSSRIKLDCPWGPHLKIPSQKMKALRV